MPPLIRPYQSSDFDAIYAMWEATLAQEWPITRRYLERMVSGYSHYREGDHFVAEIDGHVVGFAAIQRNEGEKSGSILFMMVSPDNQRQGVGRLLHSAAIKRLRGLGVEQINLAQGGDEYIWPGVPLNLPGAVDFFRACGWDFPHTNYDLAQDLTAYQTPDGVLKRIPPTIELRLCASAKEAAKVIEFEHRIFPFWAVYYQMTADDGRYADILAAWDGDNVVGSLLFDKGDVQGLAPDAVWHSILGDDMGIIGAVGVNETHEGRGIGLAMVARASEILRGLGVRQCLIGWTELINFYGKLGYGVWRSYAVTDGFR